MEDVGLIAGKLNKADNQVLYWKNEFQIQIGDFAIVENRNSFDLVEVVGVVFTHKNKVNNFSKTQYGSMKKTVRIIKREDLVKENFKGRE